MRAPLLIIPVLCVLAACGDETVTPPPAPFDPKPPFELTWGAHGRGAGEFYQPTAIAAGDDGSIYVLDNQNTRVQKFTNTGAFVRSWGDSTDPRLSALLRGVASYGDRVYVSDLGRAATYVYTTEGEYLATWDFISMDSGMAVDREGNVILSGYQVLRRGFIVDLLGPHVWRLSPEGEQLARWTMNVLQIAVDTEGNLYGVATKFKDGESRAFVLKFSPEGVFMSRYGLPNQLTIYDAVAVNRDGDIFVANRPNASIYRFAQDGELLAFWKDVADSEQVIRWPAGIAIDGDGDLFVTDFSNDRVLKWSGP